MRSQTNSILGPIASVTAAVAFLAVSLWLAVDVSRLRAELEASAELLEAGMRTNTAAVELLEATRSPNAESDPERISALVSEATTALEKLNAAELPAGSPLGMVARAEELVRLHARYGDAAPAESAAALAELRDAGVTLARDSRALVHTQIARNGATSEVLGSLWSVALGMLLVACALAALVPVFLHSSKVRQRNEQRTRRALEDARSQLGTVVANAPILVWTIDAQGTISLSEGAALSSIKLLPGEQVGRSFRDVYADAPQAIQAHERALAGEAVDYRTSLSGVAFEALLIPMRGPDGALTGATGIATDISAREQARQERRRAENHRVEMQKAEALTRIAGGVAHEFSNLLTVVSGFATLLKGHPALNANDRDDIAQILRAAGRATELTQQLLAFSRQQRSDPRTVDLYSVVCESQKMLETLLGALIEVRVLRSSGVLAVRIDPGQFQQVLLNLGLNARDAMPDGGSFTLAMGQMTVHHSPAESLLASGEYAWLSVSDSGIGMDEETRLRVFEPFFTTKGPQRGTGLGLPTVQGILRQAGGDITIESAPGQGAKFRIYLPLRDPMSVDAETDTQELHLPGGNETVLIAEDEPMVRAFTARVLRRAGYEVIEAMDGHSALETVRTLNKPIDLLVTDLRMPGMKGEELAESLHELQPKLPVVFLSGYAHETTEVEYLQKPFSPQALCRTVRTRLDEAEPAR